MGFPVCCEAQVDFTLRRRFPVPPSPFPFVALFRAWTYELETLDRGRDDRGLAAAQSLVPAHCLATYSAQAAV